MVAHDQFPMFRLVTLLARQLSAPIASRIKEYARTHPRFGRAVCMRAGRAHRAAELRFKLWSLRLAQPAATPPVSDQVALSAGADIIGEVIIFTLGAAIVIFEVNRQADKQESKVLAERSQWVAAALQLEELREEVTHHHAALERLRVALRAVADAREQAKRPASDLGSPSAPSSEPVSPPAPTSEPP